MKKHGSRIAAWTRTLGLAAATTTAMAPGPARAASLDGAPAARAAPLTPIPSSSWLRARAASNPETFEYWLVPFSPFAFGSLAEFEEELDALGAVGLGSVLHVVNDIGDRGDDQRLMMRSEGGDQVRVIDYGIEVYRVDPGADPVEVWVAEWDRLGAEGKIPVFLFQQGNRWLVVTETTRLDGERLTWSWDLRRAGRDEFPSPTEYRRAAKQLAKAGYMPITIGFSDDRSKYYVVGIGETTAGEPKPVRLRFQSTRLSLPAAEFIAHVNRQGRRGFRLAALEMFGSPENAVMVFAQIKENGRKTKRKRCVLVPVKLNPPESMLDPLNARGAAGRRVDFVTNVEDVFSPNFVLCDASQSTHRY